VRLRLSLRSALEKQAKDRHCMCLCLWRAAGGYQLFFSGPQWLFKSSKCGAGRLFSGGCFNVAGSDAVCYGCELPSQRRESNVPRGRLKAAIGGKKAFITRFDEYSTKRLARPRDSHDLSPWRVVPPLTCSPPGHLSGTNCAIMDRISSGPRTLFPQGPEFTLENFSNNDFIVRDFVDSLAESAVPINRRSGPAQPAFDPKPLIRTFESTCAP
jgi:hypothetical protein